MELFMFESNIWNYLTVCKWMSSNHSFNNNVTYELFAYKNY